MKTHGLPRPRPLYPPRAGAVTGTADDKSEPHPPPLEPVSGKLPQPPPVAAAGVLADAVSSQPIAVTTGVAAAAGASPHPLLAAGVSVAELPQPLLAAGVSMAELPQPLLAAGVSVAELPHPLLAAGVSVAELPQPLLAAGVSVAELPQPLLAAGVSVAELPQPLVVAEAVAAVEGSAVDAPQPDVVPALPQSCKNRK